MDIYLQGIVSLKWCSTWCKIDMNATSQQADTQVHVQTCSKSHRISITKS